VDRHDGLGSFYRNLIAAALSVVCGGAAAADLLSLYRIAHDSDPTFEVARYTRDATEQKVPQARAGLLPTVGISGNDGRTHANTEFSDQPTVDRNVTAWTWSLQLTQPILRMQNVYAYKESLAQEDAAEARLAQAEQDLILRLAQAYFDELTAEDALSAAGAQLRAMEEQWRQAKRGFETGVRAITDVHEAKSKLDDAKAQQVAAQNDVESKLAELERIVGPVTGHLAALGEAPVMPAPEPANVDAWMEQAREQNPSVRAQTGAVEAAEAEISRNRAEHLPTLDLTVSRGGNFSSGSLTTPLNYSTNARSVQTGVQLTIPLFAGGGVNARISEAVANRSKEAAQLEEDRRKAAADARQAYSGIVNGLARVDALESAIVSGESAVKGNQVGYRMGLRINTDVLSAQQQLYASRRDLSKARYDVLLNGLRLKAAAGVLTEADVEDVNRMLTEMRE
jgi:outer membrane protein